MFTLFITFEDMNVTYLGLSVCVDQPLLRHLVHLHR